MTTKSAVSALQEFCAKNKISAPIYTSISENGVFTCRVEVMDIKEYGEGRSKRDAKHLAAINALKRLKTSHLSADLTDLPSSIADAPPPAMDMIKVLRDYCCANEHPLPTIEILLQCGTPDAPQFIAKCKVSSVERFGSSDKKKDAKQKAAAKVYEIILECDRKENLNSEVVSLESKILEIEAERREIFKTYREFIDSGKQTDPSVPISDRHNYFVNFYQPLKSQARSILANSSNLSKPEQVEQLLKALHLRPTYNRHIGEKDVPLMTVEFNCTYDVMLVAKEDEIFDKIIRYFQIMLKEPNYM